MGDQRTMTGLPEERANAVKKLMEQKSNLEEEIEALCSYLNQPGMPGRLEPLVDAEGFPRADIDVVAVRQTRHKLCCLETDYKALMKEIETGLHQIHATSCVRVPTRSSQSGADLQDAAKNWAPFAEIDQIFPESPASEAGILLNDRVCKFGDITRGPDLGAVMKSVAELVQAKKGEAIDVVVDRAGQYVALSMTPKDWSGRGLVGCHLKPM